MNQAEARKRFRRKLLRGHRASEAGRFDEAERIYREYNNHCPDDVQVIWNLGVLVQRRANCPAERKEAMEFYHDVIAKSNGDLLLSSNAMNNMGLIMGKVNHIEEATICFHLATQMNPDNAAARVNLGDVLRHNGDYTGANREFAEVLRLDPTSAAARFSAGMIALMLGDLKRGFELYEPRFGVESFPTKPFNSEKPLWTDQDLSGKTILLWEEQGFGDTFMFIRYARKLKELGATVLFRGNALYRNILKGVDCLDGFSSVEEKAPDFDFHCPLMSLPHRFGTTLETVPNKVPYIRPVAGWKSLHIPQVSIEGSVGGRVIGRGLRMEFPLRKKMIGLCWAGSPRHGKDAWRSIPPESFQPLIDAHPEHVFYSLQIGPRADECARLKSIVDLASTVTDWTDTAQVIQQLDLIITVDTALVHLAGALDKPCWMLTPFSPDWRWMLTREDSPWYPKLRLFRQPTQNDWETPLKRISGAL